MNPAVIILSVLFFTSAVMATVLALAWRMFDRPAHALSWALAFGVGAVQWVVNVAILAIMPRHPAGLLIGGCFVVTISLFVAIGCRQRIGRRDRPVLLYAAGVLAVALLSASAIVGWMPGQVGTANAFAGIMLVFGAVVSVPRSRRINPAELAFTICLALFGLFEFALAGVGFSMTADPADPLRNAYRAMIGIGLPCGYIGTGIAGCFLIAADLSEQLRALVSRDPLTGALNRRGLEAASAGVIATARRHGRRLVLVIADIDGFKAINDRHGHGAGDRALQAFSDTIHAAVREEDVFGRLGGDEFCLLLAEVAPGAAASVVERIRSEVEALRVDGAIRLTASFGVADGPGTRALPDMIEEADRALYEAKQQGRNRVKLAVAA